MLEKLSEILFKPDEKSGKSNRQNILVYLGILVFLGVTFILLGNRDVGNPSAQTENQMDLTSVFNNSSPNPDSAFSSYVARQEAKLKEILSYIEGVGKVVVSITLDQDSEYLYGYNTSNSGSSTEEYDNSGGRRFITDNSKSQDIVIYRDSSGNENTVVLTEKAPIIKGVLVVAEGAETPEVNARLVRAVKTVLGIPLHKIIVLPYGK